MKKFGHAVLSIVVGYYHVLFGYNVRLNETDKQTLEQIDDANTFLLPKGSVSKLEKAGFITLTAGILPSSDYGCKITPKGKEYLKYPPLSMGKRITILLAIAGIAATIIIGILTRHN